ncbi:MAG: hypothetical protein J5986_07365 [Roseburia sp.]|nr:hypothetical protein [Roseburia sp.]
MEENTPRQELIGLIKDQEYSSALEFYIQNRKKLPFYERHILFQMIEDGLQQRSHIAGAVVLLVIVLELNQLFKESVTGEVLDIFSFLAADIPYFHYYKLWLMPAFNALILLIVIINCAKAVFYPRFVLDEKFQPKRLTAYAGTFLILIGYIAADVEPLVRDYAYVKNNTAEVRVFSAQERNYLNYTNSDYEMKPFVEAEFEDEIRERSQGIAEFHPEYQTKPWIEKTSSRVLWVIRRDAYRIWISDEESLPLSTWQYQWFGVRDDDSQLWKNKALYIEYLPNTRAVVAIYS